ncbi:RNA-directed DNA polymerase from mobile element jockey-like, partial [Brachionus plicatilis]
MINNKIFVANSLTKDTFKSNYDKFAKRQESRNSNKVRRADEVPPVLVRLYKDTSRETILLAARSLAIKDSDSLQTRTLQVQFQKVSLKPDLTLAERKFEEDLMYKVVEENDKASKQNEPFRFGIKRFRKDPHTREVTYDLTVAYSGIILAGDFNFPRINWSRSGVLFGNHLNEGDQSFIDIINDCFLYQNVYFPTFRTNKYASTLDLIFTESGNRVIDIACSPALGDIEKAHQSIIWKYDLKHDSRVSRLLNRPRYVYHKADFELLNDFFNSINWLEDLKTLSIQSSYDKFIQVYSEACARFVPVKRTKRDKKPPWLKPDVKKAIRSKIASWDVYINSGKDESAYREYVKARNFAKNLINKKIYEFEAQIASEAKSNPKILFSYVKSKQVIKDQIRLIRTKDGTALTDMQ